LYFLFDVVVVVYFVVFAVGIVATWNKKYFVLFAVGIVATWNKKIKSTNFCFLRICRVARLYGFKT